MKPPSFRYASPGSLSEAVDLLANGGDETKLLAGGQSLLPLLNLRLARPRLLIDLNRVRGLSYMREEDAEVVIGAMTRQREAEYSSVLSRHFPILVEALTEVGHPAIRNRGTIGRSLAHADPAAELPCVMTALGARVVAVGPAAERSIEARDFFLGPYHTALREDEVLKEVRIPRGRRPAGWGFLEFNRRHGDFALAEVAVILLADESGERCAEACVVLAGAWEAPVRLEPVDQLIGREGLAALDEAARGALLEEVERSVGESLRTHDMDDESAEYRRHLAAVLVRRCVESALARWRDQWTRTTV